MAIVKVDPMDYPLSIGESWWVIHPNNAEAELDIPIGAPAVCTRDFMNRFVKNSPYRIVNVDNSRGWVSIESVDSTIVEMPRYIFARHFDAVAYIKSCDKKVSEDENVNE